MKRKRSEKTIVQLKADAHFVPELLQSPAGLMIHFVGLKISKKIWQAGIMKILYFCKNTLIAMPILHKKCPRYSGGIHIEQMLAYYYSAAFSSVAGASALSVASVFFFALPERRVFLAAAFASPLPLP